MSTSNVITHPRFAVVPVRNPPMKKGPKPKGTASFAAARRRREAKRLRAKDQARRAEAVPAGVRPEVSQATYRLIDALKLLDIPKLQRLVEEAERLVREYRTTD